MIREKERREREDGKNNKKVGRDDGKEWSGVDE
jgi:hypothetical protein